MPFGGHDGQPERRGVDHGPGRTALAAHPAALPRVCSPSWPGAEATARPDSLRFWIWCPSLSRLVVRYRRLYGLTAAGSAIWALMSTPQACRPVTLAGLLVSRRT